MGDSAIKIVRRGDLNNDGHEDVVTAKCGPANTDGASCTDYQVSMGLYDGTKVDVFEMQDEGEPPAEGETVCFNARYYAENADSYLPPGQTLPYPVGPTPKLLTKEEVVKKCMDDYKSNFEVQMACISQASDAPIEEHTLQPPYAAGAGAAEMVHFNIPLDARVQLAPRPAKWILPERGVRPGIFAPPKFGGQLKENLFDAVRNEKSEDLNAYIYALKEGAIDGAKFLSSVLSNGGKLRKLLFQSAAGIASTLDICSRDPELRRVAVGRLKALMDQGDVTFFFLLGDSPLLEADPELRRYAADRLIARWGEVGNKFLESYSNGRLAAAAIDTAEADPVYRENLSQKLWTAFHESYKAASTPAAELLMKVDREGAKAKMEGIAERARGTETGRPAQSDIYKMLDVFLRQKELQGRHMRRVASVESLPKEQLKRYADVLEKLLSDPNVLAALMTDMANSIVSEVRAMQVMPYFERYLALTTDPRKLPPVPDLFKVAKAFPRLGAYALLAIVRSGEKGPNALALFKDIASNPADSIEPGEKSETSVLLAVAPDLLPKEEAFSFIRENIRRQKRGDVRLEGYRALAEMADKEPRAASALLDGLSDPYLPVRALTGRKLLDLGEARALPLLYKALEPYAVIAADGRQSGRINQVMRDFTASLNGQSASDRFFPQATEARLASIDLDEILSTEQGGDEGKPNLNKRRLIVLAAEAVVKFGPPPGTNTESVIAALGSFLKHSKSEGDVMLAANAMASISKPDAKRAVFERLLDQTRPRPKDLFLFAIQMAKDVGASGKEKTLIYQMMLHPDEAVKSAAIAALQGVDKNAVLSALLSDSREPEAEIRELVARVLGTFHDPRSVARLVQMTRDSEASVSDMAYISLVNLHRDRIMRPIIDRACRRDSLLRRRLLSMRSQVAQKT